MKLQKYRNRGTGEVVGAVRIKNHFIVNGFFILDQDRLVEHYEPVLSIVERLRIKLTIAMSGTRTFFGFCPACNSDSPEFWDCPVCEGYDNGRSPRHPYPPTTETLNRWKERYAQQLYYP